MAWDDPYMGVEEFRARVGSVGTATDASLLAVLTSASRQIDSWCALDNRVSFNQRTAAVFYFTPRDPWLLDVPDLVSVSELATDNGNRTYDTVWAASDYDLYPIDADDEGRPFRQIRTRPQGNHAFPSSIGGWPGSTYGVGSGAYPRETGLPKGVRITGTWGWPSVPNQIKEATFLVANRLKSLWNAPFGVTGGGALGNLKMMSTDLDPFVMQMLSPFRVVTI